MGTQMDELRSHDQEAIIKVCGVGGGGGNAVTRMIEEGLKDVAFIAINTDAQALKKSPAGVRLQIGADITHGLGSGAKPEVGKKSAMEDRDRIADILSGADMVFVTAGLGGGTGTGAAPIVAEAARTAGALTVGIVTLPFSFEGKERAANARKGLEELEQHVDTLIVVPNDRVARICQNNVSLLDAFKHADEVLHNGVRAISELITIPGLINLDFADVRTIMQVRGRALMGIGIAQGENRAVRAAEEAIVCPLLEQSNIHGAMGVIANVKGGRDMRMREVEEAVAAVQKAAHPDANIIFGAVVEDNERPDIQVTVIAAGFSTDVSEFLHLPAYQDLPSYNQEKPTSNDTPNISERRKHLPMSGSPKAQPVAAMSRPPLIDPIEEREAGQASNIEFLFPQEDPQPHYQTPAANVEPDEDFNVPAFMRLRKKQS